MQRYDTYKDSGVKWLGEIPSHWEVNKAKYYLYSKKTIVGKDSANHERLALTLNGVIKRQDGDDIGLNPEKLDTYQIVESGNLIFKLIDLENFKTSRVGLTPYNGIVSPAYIRLINKGNVNMRFLEYYYLNMWHRKVFNDLGAPGVRSNLSANDLLNLCIVLPNVNEQDAIVSYLDTATAKIDAAIAQQQKMIDLLNERKQIIINRAVTNGLNPNAKMKDNGMEWIGEVPEGWEVRRLKFLLKANLMYGANESAESEDESYPRYIRITDIDEDGNLRPDTFRSLPPTKAEPYILNKGDLLFARSGATAGKTYLFNEDIKACFAGYLIKASLKETLLPEYLNYYTKSGIYDNWKKSIFIQATIPNIGAEKYANLQITLPSIKEQKDIVKHLDVETGKINQVVRNCKNQISLLQERKQIIINEVVTGKIKVV